MVDELLEAAEEDLDETYRRIGELEVDLYESCHPEADWRSMTHARLVRDASIKREVVERLEDLDDD